MKVLKSLFWGLFIDYHMARGKKALNEISLASYHKSKYHGECARKYYIKAYGVEYKGDKK